MSDENILEVERLQTYFFLAEGQLKAVDGMDFTIPKNQTVGFIGESGCGKSIAAKSVLRIVPSPGKVVGGKILLRSANGKALAESLDLARLDPRGKAIRAIRGRRISMVFQEPMSSLSPVHTVGSQITEGILLHVTDDHKEARERAIDMISRVGISNPEQRYDEYPHQLSGGMRQRAMIAMALSCGPDLLIADEPTTSLDVTVQAQIMELMLRMQDEFGMAIMYISHDLAVISEVSSVVNVVYLGRIVESCQAVGFFKRPLHPYSQGLLKSVLVLGTKASGRLETIEGVVPTPLDPPRQCGFYGRCPHAIAGKCDVSIPALVEVESGHRVRCFLHSDEEEARDE